MGVNKYNPIRDLISIQERVNKLFEDIMENEEGDPALCRTWLPSVDIYETDGEFVVKAELPEVRQEDLDIKVEDSVLTIKGERRFQKDLSKNNFHCVERKYGLFRRSFSLPVSIDQDQVKADLKDGILTIVLVKKAGAGPVHIEIS
jgi:HSP20 family protein